MDNIEVVQKEKYYIAEIKDQGMKLFASCVTVKTADGTDYHFGPDGLEIIDDGEWRKERKK